MIWSELWEIIYDAITTLQHLKLLFSCLNKSIYIENVSFQCRDSLLSSDTMLSSRRYDMEDFIYALTSDRSNTSAHVRKGECEKISRSEYLRSDLETNISLYTFLYPIAFLNVQY